MNAAYTTVKGQMIGPIRVVTNAISYETREARKVNRKIERLLARYDCMLGIYFPEGEVPQLLIFPAETLKLSKTEAEMLAGSISAALEV